MEKNKGLVVDGGSYHDRLEIKDSDLMDSNHSDFMDFNHSDMKEVASQTHVLGIKPTEDKDDARAAK